MAVIFFLCAWHGHISCDQFLRSMFSLGMTIGKQEIPCTIESLSKSISYKLNNNNITCQNVVTYSEKLYNHTTPNKGNQFVDSPTSTFVWLKVQRNRSNNGKQLPLIQS